MRELDLDFKVVQSTLTSRLRIQKVPSDTVIVGTGESRLAGEEWALDCSK
jgi:hypothetical protein